MVDMSPLKPRCREDSYRSFGMSQRVSCTLSVILGPSLNGQSKRQVISRSVTSCAGMTAFVVVVAQTKVGFLTGGRGQKFRKLLEQERHTYARATVALARARNMCVIFCPLDMKGLIGAATAMGTAQAIAGMVRSTCITFPYWCTKTTLKSIGKSSWSLAVS